MSECVRAGLANHFQAGIHADVEIQFYLERTLEQQQQQQLRHSQREAAEGATAEPSASDLHFVGKPLPAHKLLLALGSTFFNAKLENACWQGSVAGASVPARMTQHWLLSCLFAILGRVLATLFGRNLSSERESKPPAATTALPQLLVPLNSEQEVAHSREAIRFIYTGSLSAGLGFEALLRVRQQACYLGVTHCPQACDQAMLALLTAEHQQQEKGGFWATPRPRQMLKAYACHALFPEPGTSPEAASFDAVRCALAKKRFGDAVAALTRPDLYRQLLQLPAVAVRELLAADDLGADSEDSVLLLLACWLEANKKAVSAATRAELCGLVRLHRLSRPFLHHVLPVYEAFDISRADLGFLLRYVVAKEEDKERLLACEPRRRASPWYCSTPRRQVVPEEGRTVEWSICRMDLEQGLSMMNSQNAGMHVRASFGASAAALGKRFDGGMMVLANGLRWTVALGLKPDSGAVGVWVKCHVPMQLGKPSGLVDTGVRLVVHRWGRAGREEGFVGVWESGVDSVPLGVGRDWADALALGAAGSGGFGMEAQLARFSGWLHEGKITGSITYMRR